MGQPWWQPCWYYKIGNNTKSIVTPGWENWGATNWICENALTKVFCLHAIVSMMATQNGFYYEKRHSLYHLYKCTDILCCNSHWLKQSTHFSACSCRSPCIFWSSTLYRRYRIGGFSESHMSVHIRSSIRCTHSTWGWLLQDVNNKIQFMCFLVGVRYETLQIVMIIWMKTCTLLLKHYNKTFKIKIIIVFLSTKQFIKVMQTMLKFEPCLQCLSRRSF